MMKYFVLRTESILSSENTTTRFGENNTIVVPMTILENLYRYEGLSEKKKIASSFCEYVAGLNKEELYSRQGTLQPNGSRLRILDNKEISPEIEKINNLSSLDKRTFQVCLDLQQEDLNNKVVLISQSPVIRLKAFKLGITAEPFKDQIFPKPKDQYTGHIEVWSSKEKINNFFANGEMSLRDIYNYNKIEWVENLFVNIQTGENCAIGRYTDGKIVPLNYSKKLPNGYKALNIEQKMLWECLMAPPEIAPLEVP